MKSDVRISKLQIIIFSVLILISGALGYLFYDSHTTNISNLGMIKQIKEENLDLSQDNEILKDRNEKLKTEIKSLKSRPVKVVYKKSQVRRSLISSAGKSSKHKFHKTKHRVNYKKMYFELKRNCKNYSYSYKYRTRWPNFIKHISRNYFLIKNPQIIQSADFFIRQIITV